MPALGTLRFAHEALHQSSPCGDSLTAAKKGLGFQERVSGGFWEAVLQTLQGTCLFEDDPGPRERGSSLLMSTDACQGSV